MSYVFEPPNAVQIEFTEGCNLACTFCGINGIRAKAGGPFLFMTPAVASRVARGLADVIRTHGWNPRIEFAMHGEPTMNPDHVQLVQIFRAHLPHQPLMMTSNGGGLLKGDTARNIDALLDAGLNVLALDNYSTVNIVPKIQARVAEDPLGVRATWYDYPAQPEGNPHRRRNVQARDVVVVADIASTDTGTHSTLSNHCGAAAPLSDHMNGKRCAKPFRELSIRYDGNVALCCEDWRGTYRVGNATVSNLDTLWQGAAMRAARRKLYHGERDFGPCKGCTHRSYRTGLLPDKYGKETLPRATAADKAAIEAALKGKPYATIVIKRDWERETR
jgi:hypothetical protein